MKKLKKLFITLIIACLVIIAFGEISNVKAESAGPMYLGIVSLRRSGYGYTQSGKKVWKIAQYTSTNEFVTIDLSCCGAIKCLSDTYVDLCA